MGEFSARSSFDRDTCLLRDALFLGWMFIGFMSSRAGFVTTFETLKFTWLVVVFCGLFLYMHGKIYLLHFMWRLLLLQLMLIILTIGEKSALTLIVPEEAPAQARRVSHLCIQRVRLEGLSASQEVI